MSKVSHMDQFIDLITRPPELSEVNTVPVTMRMSSKEVFYIDVIAKEFNYSRAGFLSELSSVALSDFIEKLGRTNELDNRYVEFLLEKGKSSSGKEGKIPPERGI